ncbi:hypothetical protein FALBO_5803 [Fusarium albosuccineum]|uniref:Uncharacterized protein n=1 Tax=Fusarium albosuccineum TaxID=1237068 RepID=A0A8H4PF74_9HYPO|nr:hypothetical protein FALBO_5803 [Fusarium albosuccineum]
MKKPWKSTPGAGGSARPRTGQQTIRGRISGPVPIPTPLDDEFPIRNPGTNIATPVRAEFKESQHDSAISTGHRQFKSPTFPEPRRNSPQTFRDEPRSPTHARIHGATARLQKAEPSNNARHSFVSADAVHIRDKDRPQRKQSTLRGALGKLFNRRKKPNGHDSPNNTDSEAGSVPPRPGNYRRSTGESHRPADLVPNLRPREGPDARARNRPFPGAESKRSASLPITEFDRALGSHSVRPEDIRTIESARNSLSVDFGISQARASALRVRESHLAGLSPRPASSHGRESRQEQHEEDPDEIGRAITSDFAGVRRRSRSLSGLPEAEEDHGNTRRRSDEIRYWRESYDPAFMSPVSSDAPEAEDTSAARAELTQNVEETHPKPSAEPFQFDSFVGMNEAAGMKITHAANLETRINNLESRVHRLEQVLDRMCDTTPNWRSELQPPDRPAPPIPINGPTARSRGASPIKIGVMEGSRSSSNYHSERNSQASGHEATAFLDPHFSTSFGESTTNRPTSTATIRGANSLPSLLKDTPGSLTMDHYTTLLALIHTERSAREALETQVKRLGNQLSVLSNSTAMARNDTFEPPPTAKSFGDRSAFDHDDEEGDLTTLAINTQSHGRLVDPEDSGIGTAHGDESEYSESFETPREEGHSFGAFGEDLDREDQAQTKAARTLSLSQLTMGRNPQNTSQHPRRVI